MFFDGTFISEYTLNAQNSDDFNDCKAEIAVQDLRKNINDERHGIQIFYESIIEVDFALFSFTFQLKNAK
jgi:hypothetical protein